jgi:hypothetical protein
MPNLVSSHRNIPYGGGKIVRCREVKTRFGEFSYSLGFEVRLAGSWRLEMLDAGDDSHWVF